LKVLTGTKNLEVDAAVVPSRGRWSVFELKYVASRASAAIRISDGLQHLARVVNNMDLDAKLIVVVSDDVSSQAVQVLKKMATERASLFKSSISVYVDRYTDFINLPAEEFAQRLALGT
jgi:hypothetical protein